MTDQEVEEVARTLAMEHEAAEFAKTQAAAATQGGTQASAQRTANGARESLQDLVSRASRCVSAGQHPGSVPSSRAEACQPAQRSVTGKVVEEVKDAVP